jgi:hypothetical protein
MTKSQAQSEGPLEHHKIYQLFEERKASYQTTSKKPDLTVVIRLSPDQLSQGSLIIKRLSLVCNRDVSLIHLATLVAFKNDLTQDEWPNFEFYADTNTVSLC